MALEGMQLGQYRLLHLLGSGGMGEVYLAEDARINQRVAIKVSRTEAILYPSDESIKDSLRLFQREAKAIAQLDHPSILPLFSYGEEHINGMTLTYIVMPYRREGTFAAWMQQRSSAGLLPVKDVAYFIRQAAEALQHAHDNHIVHQDVKPSNFLIRTTREHPTLPDLLLADFGIAKLSNSTASVSHSIRGTPAYMAPEQWSGQPVPATDQYALAVLAYQLLTGRTPFSGGQEQVMYQHFRVQPLPPSSFNPALSKDIDAIILKALEKKASDRFPSIVAFAHALQQAALYSDDETVTIPRLASSNPDRTITSSYLNAMNETALPLKDEQPDYAMSAIPNPSTPIPNPSTPIPNSFPVIPSTPRQQGISNVKSILLICLFLLVLAASTGYFFIKGNNHLPSNHTDAVATTHANDATATMQPNNITVTSQTALYPPPGAALALNDPLSDNNAGHNWVEGGTDSGSCSFKGRAYHVSSPRANDYPCAAQNTHFANFTYEIELKIIKGDCGAIVFRGDILNQHFYYFGICQDGTYQLWLYTQKGSATLVFASGSFSPIHTGLGQTNVLAVVANNNQITAYVNYQQIGPPIDDSTYSQGQIGVATDNDNNPTDVAFNNARVWTF
jgi:serine/threonine protein kinase